MNIEKIVAWFMSWAVWNPTFVGDSIKCSVATLKKNGGRHSEILEGFYSNCVK